MVANGRLTKRLVKRRITADLSDFLTFPMAGDLASPAAAEPFVALPSSADLADPLPRWRSSRRGRRSRRRLSRCRGGECRQIQIRLLRPVSCRWIHGNVELGRIAAKHLVELQPQSLTAYNLLSSIYAALGRWESAQEVRDLMGARNVEKDKALSWLEIDRKLHLDTQHNRMHHPERNTSSVLELLADESSLYDTESMNLGFRDLRWRYSLQ